jgi:hypothetical protein
MRSGSPRFQCSHWRACWWSSALWWPLCASSLATWSVTARRRGELDRLAAQLAIIERRIAEDKARRLTRDPDRTAA